jgi:N-acetylneuraminate synthase
MELDAPSLLPRGASIDVTVHSPEMFAGDHLLDLASDDERHRRRSCDELRRVLDVSRTIADTLASSRPPFVIVNVGGFTFDRALPTSARMERYQRVAASLREIDQSGVEIVPQTMPPFPWLRGGQLYHNLFVDPVDTAGFCVDHGYRLCLDVSHTKLAANHLGLSFRDTIEVLGPHVAYLHLVDAEGVDGEGLQIGDGEIDFAVLAEQLDVHAPQAPFIPEIWQGHTNGGEGFWLALDRLERWF